MRKGETFMFPREGILETTTNTLSRPPVAMTVFLVAMTSFLS